MSPSKTRYADDSWSSRFVYVVIRSLVCGLTRLITRLKIEGQENLPPTGAYVLAPVHRSYVDTPIIACLTSRRLRFMAKQEVWDNRPAGWLVSALGAFPVKRGTVDREAFNRCIMALEGGEPVVLFAEGERKDGPLIQPLFDGAAYIASRAGVPIIPVGIGGSARVMPRHAKMIYPKKVHVVIGKPIYPQLNGSGRASRKAIAAVTEQLSEDLQRLFDAAQSRVG